MTTFQVFVDLAVCSHQSTGVVVRSRFNAIDRSGDDEIEPVRALEGVVND